MSNPIIGAISRFFSNTNLNGTAVNYRRDISRRMHAAPGDQRDIYAVLKAFYFNSNLYEELRSQRLYVTTNTPLLKAIRNPIPSAVDFFIAKSWPKPLLLVSKNETTAETSETTDPVLKAIELIWKSSNWKFRKRLVAFAQALYGEVYIKVVMSVERQRVWFEVIEPQYVYDYESDERDFLTWIRLDVPKCDENYETGEKRNYTRTEVWSKDEDRYRVWETDGDAYGRPLNQLGTLITDESGSISEMGIDFIPFVRIPFRDIGEKRAIGAVQVAVEPVVEADLMATNLHGVLFNDLEATTVITRDGVDSNGRPLPAVTTSVAVPEVDQFGNEIRTPGQNADGTVTVGNRSLISLPGGAHLEYTTPPIAYESALAIQKDHDEHLERLMPSLGYSKITELTGTDLSGRAIRFRLTPAIDQAEEARDSLLTGLEQADKMGLSLGQANGIVGFENLGDFEAGDFDHWFVPHQVISVGEYEEAQTEQLSSQAFGAWVDGGLPMHEALERSGYTEEEANTLAQEVQREAKATFQRDREVELARASRREPGNDENEREDEGGTGGR